MYICFKKIHEVFASSLPYCTVFLASVEEIAYCLCHQFVHGGKKINASFKSLKERRFLFEQMIEVERARKPLRDI